MSRQMDILLTKAEYPTGAQPASLVMADEQETSIQVLPLSEEQKELWFVSLTEDTASQAYNQSLSLRLRGPLHVGALRRALQAIVERHEALRTVFDRKSAEQRILPSLPIHIEQTDCSQLTEQEQEREVAQFQRDEARRIFDLENGPLLRLRLIALDENYHILLFTIHHLIADGRSVGTILSELSVLYAAFCTNKPQQLPAALSYSSYVRQQRELEQSTRMQAAESYWLARFADIPPPLDFPTDYQRPPIKTFHGAKHHFKLDSDLCSALRKLGIRYHCTLYTTLLAGYSAFLAQITGQRDLVVPISSAGQFLVEGGDNLVGHCVKLLPIRLTITDNPTLNDYLHLVQQAVFEAQEHQIYPFSRLVQQLKLPRDPSRTPLVATDFNLDVAGDLHFMGLATEVQNNVKDFAQFDFSLNITRSQDELLVECSYNTDLFAAETIGRWEGYFRTLLEHMVLDTTQTFSQLTFLTPKEVQQFVSEQQVLQTFYPEDTCFLDLFAQQVERTPDAIVAACEQEQLTYRALDQRASSMACLLREIGVTAEELVVVVADRSIAFLIALLAIFKAGGSYLPLSIQWPEKQYAAILERSQARFVLTTMYYQRKVRKALQTLKGEAAPRVYLLEELALEDAVQEIALPVQNPEHLAYVIYTSGSTGVPKGAMVEHKGMLNHLYAKVNELALTAHDVVAQNASQSFDISVWQFLSTLLVGGRVQIIPDSDVNDPGILLEQVARCAVSTLEIVPSLLLGLFLLIEARGAQVPELPHLRWLISTGETLPPKLARQWLNAYPHIPMMNGYGPTECSDDVTHHVIDTPPAETAMLVPIGHRLANLELYVLDRDLQILPPGIAGELYVGGIGVGRGYVHDPVTTAQTFVPHPFVGTRFIASEPGRRLYKTGDRVRVGRDGNFEFLGRIDHQVKVRGFRIELGEIEANLYKHDTIQDVAVIVREDEPGDKRLVAYIIPVAGVELSSKQVRSWIRERIPEYMVPSAFLFLERFPLTANGKIDTRALPTPERSTEGIPGTAPRNAIESMLADIWQSVLHRNGVGVHDNFFELGGDSIMSIKIIARLNEAGFTLTTREIFQYQTIAELAGVVMPTNDFSTKPDEVVDRALHAEAKFYDASLVDVDAQTLTDLLSKVRF
ncbi:MAG TPA: amino acid adenylation domain-containing protein [Ktedonobacteraceae bacterium]|nr:amino acid adenylation domain-containing protein [Ktedonobacteraceae bacterium]